MHVVALGVTTEGVKVPLGLWEGSTENATLARSLLADLVDRGLDPRAGDPVRVKRSGTVSREILAPPARDFTPSAALPGQSGFTDQQPRRLAVRTLLLLVPCGSPLGTTAQCRSSHRSRAAATLGLQPQFHELAPVRASRLAAFRQTPAEDREITDRLLTIGSGVSS